MDPRLMSQIDVFGLIVTQGQLGTALAIANTRIAELESENKELKTQLESVVGPK